MNPPLVTIGFVTRNRPALLRRALEETARQTFTAYRVEILDDASEPAIPPLALVGRELHQTRTAANLGIPAARNRLMRECGTRYYCSLDDDSWFVEPDGLAEAVAFLERSPRVAAVACSIASPERPQLRPRGGVRPADMFVGCGHVLRMDAVLPLGGYAPLPGFYGGEEKELSLRLLDAGWDVVELTGINVWHEKTNVARDQPRQHRSGVCNDLAFAASRFPLPALAWMLPGKVFNHLRFSRRHRLLGPCWRGFGDFVRQAGAVWRARRPVRAATLREYQRRVRASVAFLSANDTAPGA